MRTCAKEAGPIQRIFVFSKNRLMYYGYFEVQNLVQRIVFDLVRIYGVYIAVQKFFIILIYLSVLMFVSSLLLVVSSVIE